ncbi:MurR/RpiR family transcriptional regulator [Longibaculum muris]|uniref:MurR/RpiR family transcriptional regulator n=1 Tax=Longibaculum muris TaxID=1796628 RepID=UPI0022E4BC41|nr:MurR/RpiR family transcriptional regulator [Longibaculum muris]
MLLEQKIKNLEKLSGAEQAIVNYILTSKHLLKKQTTRDIAKKTYTSASTLVHFAKKLGYSGFNELKEDYLNELEYIESHFKNIDANIPFVKDDSLHITSGKIKKLFQETIDDTYALIDFEQLELAINLICKSNHIVLFGIGSTSLLLELFKQKITRINKKAIIESRVGEYIFNINTLDSNDCAILVSYSGESESVLNYALLLKERNIPFITITSLGENSLSKISSLHLNISTREKQYSKISSFSSDYSIEFILDLIYSGVFLKDYDNNFKTKINLSKTLETCKFLTNPLIKEE